MYRHNLFYIHSCTCTTVSIRMEYQYSTAEVALSVQYRDTCVPSQEGTCIYYIWILHTRIPSKVFGTYIHVMCWYLEATMPGTRPGQVPYCLWLGWYLVTIFHKRIIFNLVQIWQNKNTCNPGNSNFCSSSCGHPEINHLSLQGDLNLCSDLFPHVTSPNMLRCWLRHFRTLRCLHTSPIGQV